MWLRQMALTSLTSVKLPAGKAKKKFHRRSTGPSWKKLKFSRVNEYYNQSPKRPKSPEKK
jgi:hypothetical protein